MGQVQFIPDTRIRFMQATWQPSLFSGTQYKVTFNPRDITSMSNDSLYFVILHEFAHLHFKHPGNSHKDSAINEIQADDTAVVTAITKNPFIGLDAARGMDSLIDAELAKGNMGGGSHPSNIARKKRLRALVEAIFKYAQLNIAIKSPVMFPSIAQKFATQWKDKLGLAKSDFKKGKTAIFGEEGYQLDACAPLDLTTALKIKPHLDEVQNWLFGGFITVHTSWKRNPLEVQKAIKNRLP